MTPVVALASIVLVPAVLLMVLRVNATLVFLSLCLGNVLVQFVVGDANSLITSLSTSHLTTAHVGTTIHTTDNTIKLILLLAPVLLTSLFMIKTVRGYGRLALNVLPAAGVGLLGGLLVVPLLPPGLSHNIVTSSLWHQAQNVQSAIVGASAVVCLLVLWLQRPKAGHGGKHGKH